MQATLNILDSSIDGSNLLMILQQGEHVYWGAPEVMYLEGMITALSEENQSATVHIERATPNTAHLIGSEVLFFVDGLAPLPQGRSAPPGTTTDRDREPPPPLHLNDQEKIRRAASVAIHQIHGYTLPPAQEGALIEQVRALIEANPAMRAQTLESMNKILGQHFSSST